MLLTEGLFVKCKILVKYCIRRILFNFTPITVRYIANVLLDKSPSSGVKVLLSPFIHGVQCGTHSERQITKRARVNLGKKDVHSVQI